MGFQSGASDDGHSMGGRRVAVAQGLVAERSPSGGPIGGIGLGGEGSGGSGVLLSERDLKQIERDNPAGLTSVQIVDFFAQRGLRFSEATFRKYVQLGLVPRSRRVGRKGKHQGSMGLYPPSTVRRINTIKRHMEDNYTIEEIQQKVLKFRDDIDTLERCVGSLFDGFEVAVDEIDAEADLLRALKKDVQSARKAATDLLGRIDGIAKRLIAPRGAPRGGAAPIGTGLDDLL